MGAVYLARQLIVDRPVALKVLKPDVVGKPGAVERFMAEAKAVSQLRNPHTVTLYDVGHTDNGELYYAMEFIDGGSVAEAVAAGPMPWQRALGVVAQVAESLAEAHDRGIYHRDIKPDNVLLDTQHGGRDFARVVDFGIAKLQNDGVDLTQTGMILGTPAYLSPEQARGKLVDGQTDIYSLGVVLYEMLTGRRPFRDREITTLLFKHVHQPAPSLREALPELSTPAEVDALVQDMLAKDPLDRPRSARTLQARIAEILEPPVPPPPANPRIARVAAGLAGSVLIAGGVLAFIGSGSMPTDPDARVIPPVPHDSGLIDVGHPSDSAGDGTWLDARPLPRDVSSAPKKLQRSKPRRSKRSKSARPPRPTSVRPAEPTRGEEPGAIDDISNRVSDQF